MNLRGYYNHTYSIEGGDILNLSNKVLAIRISQRTTAEAIELLAQSGCLPRFPEGS